jgi:formyl-CoA transferase
MFPYDVFPASDGYVAIGVGADWPGLCRILGLDDLAEREDLINMAERLKHRQELKARMSQAIRRNSTDFWLHRLQEADILSGPVYSLDQVMADPAMRHAGMEIELQHSTAGTVKSIDSAPAFQVGLAGGRPVTKRRRPPPMLGEHTLEILAELGYSDAEVERLCAGAAVSFLP